MKPTVEDSAYFNNSYEETRSSIDPDWFRWRQTQNVSFRGADFNINTNPSLCLVGSRRKKNSSAWFLVTLHTTHNKWPDGSTWFRNTPFTSSISGYFVDLLHKCWAVKAWGRETRKYCDFERTPPCMCAVLPQRKRVEEVNECPRETILGGGGRTGQGKVRLMMPG